MTDQGDNQAGTNIYLGRGGMGDVNFAAPVAFLPADRQTIELPLPLEPGADYAIVACRVSPAGVEERSRQAGLRVRVSSDGQSVAVVLPVPSDLVAERLADGRLRLSCSIVSAVGLAVPESVDVFTADADAPFDTATPVASVDVGRGDGEVHVTFDCPALPCRLSARCIAGQQAGDLAGAIRVAEGPALSPPAALPQEVS
ncbi:MAG: hypothetical protein ACLFVY_06100 [Phycisphaerae bacterium]